MYSKYTNIIPSGCLANKLNILIVLLFVVLNGILSQQNYEIEKIYFKGNNQFTKAELLLQMLNYEYGPIAKYIQRKEAALFSEEFAKSDADRIRLFYQSQGYLNASVKFDSIRQNDKKQKVKLFYSITENKPYLVSKLTFIINNKTIQLKNDSLFDNLKNTLLLTKSERFVDEKLNNDIQSINNLLINNGFLYSKTKYELKLNTDSSTTEIIYIIDTAEKCKIGNTTIEGNIYLKNKYIEKQISYDINDNFSNKKLEKTKENLYNLQLFRIVSVNPQTNRDTRINPVPIKLLIQEMPRWSARYNVGWGTEDKIRTSGDFTFRSPFGGTNRLNLLVKYSALNPYFVSLSWTQPQFFVRNLAITVNPYFKMEVEPGYKMRVTGINFPVNYEVNKFITATGTYYFEKVKQYTDSSNTDILNPENDDFRYNKSGISGGITLNYSKPTISPEKGFLISLGAKMNGYIFGSDFNYTRLWSDVRFYQKLGRFTLAERAMIGNNLSADSTGFIPVEDRWYSGGINSNRGWGRAQIGTKRSDGTPIGGKRILETNFEVRHPLFGIVDFAAFIDASNVWNSSSTFKLTDLHIATGGGLRINTPIGPIRFDVGVPIWNEKKRVQFNLSVGQAF